MLYVCLTELIASHHCVKYIAQLRAQPTRSHRHSFVLHVSQASCGLRSRPLFPLCPHDTPVRPRDLHCIPPRSGRMRAPPPRRNWPRSTANERWEPFYATYWIARVVGCMYAARAADEEQEEDRRVAVEVSLAQNLYATFRARKYEHSLTVPDRIGLGFFLELLPTLQPSKSRARSRDMRVLRHDRERSQGTTLLIIPLD
ncbi:hypothetical protein BD413DRAFT_6497 [Trametes elegans]|nr:hypothetical protein BD413DRAFT_6497 [Trametes elegans]